MEINNISEVQGTPEVCSAITILRRKKETRRHQPEGDMLRQNRSQFMSHVGLLSIILIHKIHDLERK